MFAPIKDSKNPLKKLPYNLRCELASFVDNNANKYNTEPARDRAFAFARSVVSKLNVPYDIKNYLDKAGAARLKKHGLKRAMKFIDDRSAHIVASFGLLPEPWYRVDTEYKRVRLADELTGRARLHLDLALKAGKRPLEALEEINEFTGLSLWVPHFEPKKRDSDEDVYLALITRACDDAVWLRAINQKVGIAFESARRAAGMVSPHVSPYASFTTCQWLKDRQKKQLDWLDSMAIESEAGETLELKDVHDASVSNPANRRHELMTQLRGCQEYADSIGHVALMGTLTAAGRYHRLKKHGKYFVENPNWNGANPLDAHEWLKTSWQRFRAAADRDNLTYYGMRVVEPHVDGTPHWHGVFFVPRDQVSAFIELLTFYQHQRDSDELFTDDGTPKSKAMIARVKIEEIDRSKGDAVAYIAKYISKNIDAHKLEGKKDLDSNLVDLVETVTNVTAWSRKFCFRQFQFQKTPSVTVWRELRRIEKAQEFCLFEKIRLAADVGCFASYFNWMGGHRLKQRHRPVKLLHERAENHYQELVKKTIGLTGVGITVLTREKQWSLVKKEVATKDGAINAVRAFKRCQAKALVRQAADLRKGKVTKILGLLGFVEDGGSRFPWTSVNNCTRNGDLSKIADVPDIDTSNLTPKQIYAGSYFEESVEVLDKDDDLAKQRCIECGSESEFYGKSDSYLCVLHRPKVLDVCDDWKKWPVAEITDSSDFAPDWKSWASWNWG